MVQKWVHYEKSSMLQNNSDEMELNNDFPLIKIHTQKK